MNIVLFDGVCNFCNATVLQIIKYDKQNKIKFASQQSPFGEKLLATHNVNNSKFETIYFINQNKEIFTESDAVFEILKLLNGIPRIALLFLITPKFIRNYLYRLIAKNRYKWFGRKQECSIPTPEIKDKFLY
jgi:predicted DCC family thiol-disulfide oxidoreductase YuxK